MKLENASSGKMDRKVSIIFSLIILLVGSFLSFSSTPIQAASSDALKVEKSEKTSSDSSQLLEASIQANNQRAADTSILTSPLNNDVKPNSDLITAITTPLTVSVNSDGVTHGSWTDNGRGRLQANVSYLINSYINTDAVATKVNITAVDRNGMQLGGFSRAEIRRVESAGPNSAVNTIKFENGKPTSPTSVTNDSKNAGISNITDNSVSLQYFNRDNEYSKDIDKPLSNIRSNATTVKVFFSEGWSSITVAGAVLDASNTSSMIFNNTWVDFGISSTLLKDTIRDTMNNLKTTYVTGDKYKDLALGDNIKIVWKVWTNDGKNGAQDFSTDNENLYDTSYDPNDSTSYGSGLNTSASKFRHQFYRVDKDGQDIGQETHGAPVYVFADISLSYSYKEHKSAIIGSGSWNTKTGTSQVRLDGWSTAAAATPTDPDEIPKVTGTNGINDKTDPTKDQKDDVDSELATGVLDPDVGDVIKYTSHIIVDTNTGHLLGIITDGVYTTEIPKDMDIDESSINIIGNNVYIGPDHLHTSVTDDPNDSTKQILTIKGISLPGGTQEDVDDYELTFEGTTGNNTDNIDFTPSFTGAGGQTVDDNGDPSPIYIDPPAFQKNYIHYSNQPEPSGELKLDPKDIDFGTINSYIGQSSIKHRVTPNEGSNILDVSDDRSIKPATTLSIAASNLTLNGNKDGDTFPGTLVFKDKSGNESSLDNGIPTPILYTDDGDALPSISWSKNEGVLLKLKPASVIRKGTYKSTVTWTATNSI